MYDQHRIRRLHDDQVADPDAGHQPAAGQGQGIGAVAQQDVPLGHIAVRVLGQRLP